MSAIDAQNLATYSHNHCALLAALMRSIQLDTKHNEGRNADALASIGKYLVDDLSNYISDEAVRLGEALQ